MIQVRPATETDLPAIHQLVAELARYVGSAHKFTATLETYREDFAAGFFEALVAVENGEVIGMALFFNVYSTWKGRMLYLEDFVVSAAHRRRGVGQQLWEALKEIGRGRGCQLLKWQIAGHNTEALKFYERQSPELDSSWVDGKLYL